jgi:hypothetical protein
MQAGTVGAGCRAGGGNYRGSVSGGTRHSPSIATTTGSPAAAAPPSPVCGHTSRRANRGARAFRGCLFANGATQFAVAAERSQGPVLRRGCTIRGLEGVKRSFVEHLCRFLSTSVRDTSCVALSASGGAGEARWVGGRPGCEEGEEVRGWPVGCKVGHGENLSPQAAAG